MHGSQYPIWMAIVAGWTLTAAAQPATSPPGGGDPAGQILKGADPGQLPIYQPTRCELVVNAGSRGPSA